MINPLVEELASFTNVKTACDLLGRPRASHYRATTAKPGPEVAPRPAPRKALSDDERQQVLGVLTSDRFVDKSVAQVWATLLDEGIYLCSMSTMHRILRAHAAGGERRAQATHPAKTKPELVATKPGQVWSWDITKLRGPTRGVYYDLYVVLDTSPASSWPGRSPPVRTARSPRRCSSRRWECTVSLRRSTPTGAPR